MIIILVKQYKKHLSHEIPQFNIIGDIGGNKSLCWHRAMIGGSKRDKMVVGKSNI